MDVIVVCAGVVLVLALPVGMAFGATPIAVTRLVSRKAGSVVFMLCSATTIYGMYLAFRLLTFHESGPCLDDRCGWAEIKSLWEGVVLSVAIVGSLLGLLLCRYEPESHDRPFSVKEAVLETLRARRDER